MGRAPGAFRERIVRVCCVKSKVSCPARSREPYTSPPFAGRLRWALAGLLGRGGGHRPSGSVHDLRTYTFEIHAGAAYFDFGLRDTLVAEGAAVEILSLHLRLSEQLALYRRGPQPNG
ncbi:MAG: hypothetical protein ACYCS9_06615 [Candidatus Dormibacteria bacterium]